MASASIGRWGALQGSINGWDQKPFDRSLAEYIKVSKRTVRQIVITKLYFIARKAIWFTRKADIYSIHQRLGGMVKVDRLTKKGKVVKRRVLQLPSSTSQPAPLAVLILMRRWADAGKGNPFKGQSRRAGAVAMAKATRKFIGASIKSVAFIKSCWLPSVRKLAPEADKKGQPQVDISNATEVGRPKGDAILPTSEAAPVGSIVNMANSKHDLRGAVTRFATDGLLQAFSDEAASMDQYVEEHMKPDADKFNQENR